MVCFLEGILGQNFDYRMALANAGNEPALCNDHEYRLLFEIINDCCNLTENPQKIRIYLERGIALTGMSAEKLSQYTADMDLSGLAEYYKNYHK